MPRSSRITVNFNSVTHLDLLFASTRTALQVAAASCQQRVRRGIVDDELAL